MILILWNARVPVVGNPWVDGNAIEKGCKPKESASFRSFIPKMRCFCA